MAKRDNTLSMTALHVAKRPKDAKLAASQPPQKTVTAPGKPQRPSMPEKPEPDDLQAIFGENLKAARLEIGLKQSEIAERIGWTQQRLSLIEAGKQNLTLKTMTKLAEVVDHDVIALLRRVQTRSKKK